MTIQDWKTDSSDVRVFMSGKATAALVFISKNGISKFGKIYGNVSDICPV